MSSSKTESDVGSTGSQRTTSQSALRDFRNAVVEDFRTQLFGPAQGPDEQITGKPFWRYLCGILFPSEFDWRTLSESDEPDAPAVGGEFDTEDPALALAYESLPSSMGITFFVSGAETLYCDCEGALYEAVDGARDTWKRRELASTTAPASVALPCPRPSEGRRVEEAILDGKAKVCAVFRPRSGGHLVTVTLINTMQSAGDSLPKNVESMLFQCRFAVRLRSGAIGEYPTVAALSRHPEDDELTLIFRERKTYGIGHGCAAIWNPHEARTGLQEIFAEPLPSLEVKGLTNDIELPESAAHVLSIQWLANPEVGALQLRDALHEFLDTYEQWIDEQTDFTTTFSGADTSVADRIVRRQRVALERMRDGVEVLTSDADPDVLKAFRIAQEAMLRQFLWGAHRGTALYNRGEAQTVDIDPWSSDHAHEPRWRPFQLGFLLLVLRSLVEPDSPDRETLDLLWFPTGGGKTEAYLALSAFEIVFRRLRYADAGSGTAVLMRYTLRLLTSQQFERCAALVSALERMRRQRPELDLGEEPIRLGLWVGGETTPNRLDYDSEDNPGAFQIFQERILHDETPDNPFQLLGCPRCGTRIVPEKKGPIEEYGLDITPDRFRVFCPDARCELHEEIPVSVVDEDLFKRPPSVLIGTIDKFARMVWDVRPGVFLGRGTETLPPGLIVQDELHLITGPLGTIAGMYEAAIDTVLQQGGTTPKYIAATATIQRAQEQCRALYARKAFIFPPSGLLPEDSFFSKEDSDAPGRTFVGTMGHGLYSSLTSLIQVSAAAADAAQTVPEAAVVARDSYWTQVIYHNSRQELGKTTTMLRDDVRSRLEILEPIEEKRREFESVEELSANLKGSQVSDALERLRVAWPSPDAIDAVACTNMISVGVDVPRLGLMIVKGQPKSTAEYIQASSRVGRSAKRPPGVVVALYSANRPRDRSHYESFQAYHQALYRAVEPVTVTPFAPPARERTLHAALVLTVRHVMGWNGSRHAQDFDPEDPAIRGAIDLLKARLCAACPDDERSEILDHLDELIDAWHTAAKDDQPPPLTFNSGRQYRQLLYQYSPDHERRPGMMWPTLNSMRHVDGETRFEVRGEARDNAR